MTSSACHSQAVTSVSICAAILPWVVTAALGLLVVPLVKTIIARRCGESSGNGDTLSVRVSLTVAIGIDRRSHKPWMLPRVCSSTMTCVTPALVRQCSHSDSAEATLRGIAIPPARHTPWSAVT